MLSETIATPTGIFSAMLFGAVALLFGFGIGVMISEVLPDIIRTFADLRLYRGGQDFAPQHSEGCLAHHWPP